MRAVYLHVGLHKTGTTSIQEAFFAARAKLLAHDIDYFAADSNHSHSLYPLFCDPEVARRYLRRFGLLSQAQVDRRNADIEAGLRQAIEASKASRFVISGEDLSNLPGDGVERLKRTLDPLAGRIKVIAYVRDPDEGMTSAFQQQLRTGRTEAQVALTPPWPAYSKLRRYIDAFGRGNVDIRVFDRRELVGGDLRADFLTAIDAKPELVDLVPKRRLNISLTQDAATVLNEINIRQLGRFGRPNRRRTERIAKWLVRLPGEVFTSPPEAYVNARAIVEPELDWLHATLGRTVFALKPPRERKLRWSKGLLSALATAADLAVPRGVRQSSLPDFRSAS